jgi:hypothetical protein
MKIIIAGGRHFNNYVLLKQWCDFYFKNLKKENIEIVSGTAKGADSLGERYATENGLNVKKFPANWEMYKKAAGYIRNEEMAIYADALIAFWDGKSKGTKHMIDLAEKHNLKIKVVFYNL